MSRTRVKVISNGDDSRRDNPLKKRVVKQSIKGDHDEDDHDEDDHDADDHDADDHDEAERFRFVSWISLSCSWIAAAKSEATAAVGGAGNSNCPP